MAWVSDDVFGSTLRMIVFGICQPVWGTVLRLLLSDGLGVIAQDDLLDSDGLSEELTARNPVRVVGIGE